MESKVNRERKDEIERKIERIQRKKEIEHELIEYRKEGSDGY
jgi:hypothetical protein